MTGMVATYWAGRRQRESDLTVAVAQNQVTLTLEALKAKGGVYSRYLTTANRCVTRIAVAKVLETLASEDVHDLSEVPTALLDSLRRDLPPGLTEDQQDTLIRAEVQEHRAKTLPTVASRGFGIGDDSEPVGALLLEVDSQYFEVAVLSSQEVAQKAWAVRNLAFTYRSGAATDDAMADALKELTTAMRHELKIHDIAASGGHPVA